MEETRRTFLDMSLSTSEPDVVPEAGSWEEPLLVKLGIRRGKTGGGIFGVGPGLLPAPPSDVFVAPLPPENESAAAATRPTACPTSGLEACR